MPVPTTPHAAPPATRPTTLRRTTPPSTPTPPMPRMRTIAFAVALAALPLATPHAVAHAQKAPQTLTFESVPTNAAGFNPTPFTTLGGYGFEGWGVLTQGSTFGTGTNAVSGTRFAYGFARQPQFIFRNDPFLFDFTSAFLSFRTLDGSTVPGTITVRGFRGASELFTRAITLTNSAQLFTFGWTDVSEIAFESEPLNDTRSAVLAMDDVTLATVPEPATVALLGVGVLLLGGTRLARRRR